ncbi:hypothetical protein PMAYCL1PPCAC_17354, partial [Pristionchus mayeri]
SSSQMADDPPLPQCKAGLLVPAISSSLPHAFIYLFFLLYCFLGTAIIADIFMCAIERITSTTKKIKKKREELPLVEQGEKAVQVRSEDEEYEYVKVWNPTVANLTLMALGSSAPEILLSLIEIIGNDFKAGDLGPGTIVGSAAFNLFCISAICVLSVASPAVKRIEQLSVFYITSAFSVFAYVWILFILVWSSPNIIDICEAALTLFFFLALVIIAYAFDVQLWKKRATKATHGHQVEVAIDSGRKEEGEEGKGATYQTSLTADLPVPDIATVRNMTREVARVYPSLSPEDHAKILAYRINQAYTPHDRMYYRIKAIRQMTSSWRESKTEQEVKQFLATTKTISPDGRMKPRIEWSARAYGVRKGDTKLQMTIVRRGPVSYPITVSYHTVDGTAKKNLHFMEKKESIQFEMGQRFKVIDLQLLEEADWKADAVFYVHLKIQDQEDDDRTKLGECNVARVRFVDVAQIASRHPTVEFGKPNYVISESKGWVRVYLKLTRPEKSERSFVYYETEDVSAQADLDYVGVKNGRISFEPEEIEKYVDVEIIDDKQDEKDETFIIAVTKIDNQEVPITPSHRTTVTIISDDNALKNVTNVRKLMRNYLKDMKLERASWTEQIINASSVNGGDIANATFCDAIKHGLSFPWKFMFAFVPPPEILGGWPCFFVALALIGFVTAIIGDLASIFGCMMGIGDAVTAITLVALGTSLPDTFASKIAAEQDRTADNAVGNITGSNSVNVFLGLGLPWLVAAIYWATKGEQFKVDAGDLTYSVTLFTGLSLVCLFVLTARRIIPALGQGELGGPRVPKILTGLLFVLLWIIYIVLSIVRTKSH